MFKKLSKNEDFMKKATEYFMQGYSCSESIVKAAIEKGLVNENILPLASPFSGGLSSGCLCGAVAGMQLVFGAMFGRDDKERNGMVARQLAKKSIEMFKEKNKFTCCKALTAGYDMASPERKQHCVKMVETCAEIIEELIKQPVA